MAAGDGTSEDEDAPEWSLGFGTIGSSPPGLAGYWQVDLGDGRSGIRCGLCRWTVEGSGLDEIETAVVRHLSEQHPDAWTPDDDDHDV
jgi:hypothetical protein